MSLAYVMLHLGMGCRSARRYGLPLSVLPKCRGHTSSSAWMSVSCSCVVMLFVPSRCISNVILGVFIDSRSETERMIAEGPNYSMLAVALDGMCMCLQTDMQNVSM